MERLAAIGVKFTQAYASSVSSPSRCSLLTGANAARHKVTNWTLTKNTSTDEKHETLKMPQWNVNGVQPVEGVPNSFPATSLAAILSDNGYNTINCGKAHFGATDTPSANPVNLGFNVNIAGHAAGGLASYLGKERFGHNKNGEIILKFSYPLLNEVLRIVKEEEPKVIEQVFDNDCMVRLSMRLSRLPRLIERYEKLVISSKNDLKIEYPE